MKTSELTGPALRWAVAKATGALAPLGNVYVIGRQLFVVAGDEKVEYAPDEDWSQGGPIMEDARIGHRYAGRMAQGPYCVAWKSHGLGPHKCESSRYGPTPLIAAMRCYVASKLGDDVEIPEELK